MAGVGDFELIAYSSRGEIVLSKGVSFILVRYRGVSRGGAEGA